MLPAVFFFFYGYCLGKSRIEKKEKNSMLTVFVICASVLEGLFEDNFVTVKLL